MSSRQPPNLFDGYNQGGPPPPPPPPTGTKRGRDGKEKESFKCPHPGCGQEYSRMEYLKRHQRKHQDVRPFDCKDCEKSFARSDVLLRHRRRCHPTPPPESRSSRSPGPARAYPSVPVSSSRNDARELSPPPRARRSINDYSDQLDQGHTQTRAGSDDEDEDAFVLAQQMQASGRGERGEADHTGDGGVYDIGGDYYNLGESSTYTPHLLPMFQNQSSNHPYQTNGSGNGGTEDPNHLEDASVLLSMAYPGGVPGDGSRQSGSRNDSGDGYGQNINMMMEGNGGSSSNGADVAMGESVGNFLNSMGWSGGQNQEKEDASRWVSATPSLMSNDVIDPSLTSLPTTFQTRNGSTSTSSGTRKDRNDSFPTGSTSSSTMMLPPPSPVPSLSAMFSPSLFGYPSLPPLTTGSDDSPPDDVIGEISPESAEVKDLLDELAKNDMPQTKSDPHPNPSPHPERPLLKIDNRALMKRAGMPISNQNSPFYLDPIRFTNCYEIPHWQMPPIHVLSMMAAKTYHTVLNHFSFIHQPSFNLQDTPACLAFAICTIGGIRSSSDLEKHYKNFLPSHIQGMTSDWKGRLDGPVNPEATWENTYVKNYASVAGSDNSPLGLNHSGDAEKDLEVDKRIVEEWDGGNLVRNDKTNMLVKSFSQAKGVLMTEYNCGLLQALILYHAPYYLSESENERAMANYFMGTIVSITRQIGFLTQDLDHFTTNIDIPREPCTPNDYNFAWRQWIKLETRRRTAYLVYHLDTVSALESNIPCILNSCELSNLPLPAPDTMWKAPNAVAWAKAASSYRSMTLDEAMRRIFFLPAFGSFDTLHAAADTKYYNLLNEQTLGPFARVAMVLTLVRGIMDVGEGKRDRGDWRDLTDLWMSCSWLKPGKRMFDGDGKDIGEVTRDSLKGRFAMGLERWRQGWDFDPLCSNGNGGPEPAKNAGGKTLMYVEEALPFYWLAQALLSIINSAPSQSPSFNAFHGLQYGEMLKSARTFTRLGEGAGAPSALSSTSVSSSTPSTASRSGSGSSGYNGNQNGQGTSNRGNSMGSTPGINGTEGLDMDILNGMGLAGWA